MPEDMLAALSSKNLNEFKKDFLELMRVYEGICREYSRMSKDIEKYISEFQKIITFFNKKYKSIVLKLKEKTEVLKLEIFLKDKSVKDVFTNAASKINGLKSIGSTDFDTAKIEETDKFSKELDKIKNRIFISYQEKETGSGSISLEYNNKMIELHYNEDISEEHSPEFKLCAYYAAKEPIENINIYGKLSAIGFVEPSIRGKVMNFFKKFNPRTEE